MELFLLLAVIFFSLILIVKGGDMFITSAVWIAHRTKMPQILIGATVVSLGTALPELAVSVMSAAAGDYALAVSNAVGSMLCNISVVAGFCFVLMQSAVDRRAFRPKAVMLATSMLFLLFSLADGVISHWESLIMLLIFAAYFMLSIAEARGEISQGAPPTINYLRAKQKKPAHMMFLFGCGIVFIGAGAFFLVNNIEKLAVHYLGVSTTITGVTAIALASALPEVVTAISAVKNKAAAISLGNIIGANIINSSLLTGMVGWIAHGGDVVMGDSIAAVLGGNISAAFLGAAACVLTLAMLIAPILISGRTFRWQGAMLLTVYVLYILFIMFIITGAVGR